MAKKNKGRQKIEMVKMENEINLQVTFSKRRFGLFKKASELVTLCGAEVALIVFSPGGKVYTFGHPTLQTIIEKYVHGPAAIDEHQSIFGPNYLGNLADEAERAILAVDLGHELYHKENLLECEKKIGEMMGQRIKNSSLYNRWGKFSVDELNLLELYQYKISLEELKMDIDTVKEKKALEMNTTPNTTDPFFGRNFDAPCFGFNKTNNKTLPFELPDSILSSVLHQNLGASSSSGVAAGTSFPPPGHP